VCGDPNAWWVLGVPGPEALCIQCTPFPVMVTMGGNLQPGCLGDRVRPYNAKGMQQVITLLHTASISAEEKDEV
jgi:hypothetical protein